MLYWSVFLFPYPTPQSEFVTLTLFWVFYPMTFFYCSLYMCLLLLLTPLLIWDIKMTVYHWENILFVKTWLQRLTVIYGYTITAWYWGIVAWPGNEKDVSMFWTWESWYLIRKGVCLLWGMWQSQFNYFCF